MARGNPKIKEAGKQTRFSSKNQPKNRGKKGKSVTDWLREYGEATELEFEVTVTKPNGQKKKQKGKVESETTINQLLAVTILNKAIQGDNKAITTYLDRTEGKPKQHIDIDSNVSDFPSREERDKYIAKINEQLAKNASKDK